MFSDAKTIMHPIEAMNHRKSGFFPTDMDTMNAIFSRLHTNVNQTNLLDPCCGEGDALSQFKKILPNAKTFGIELDQTRYEIAKTRIDHAYYANIYDVSIGRGNFDLLFLNPPYGNDMTDNLSNEQTERLEHKFLIQTFSALKADGVLVYIIPGKSLDQARMKWLLARFKDLTVFKASVDTYKQIVVMGKKLRQQRAVSKKMLEQFMQRNNDYSLFPDHKYELTHSKQLANLRINRLSEIGISEIRQKHAGQWNYFDALFGSDSNGFKRPITSVAKWHLALLITSGAVQGPVVSNCGKKTLFIKGAVKKKKKTSQTISEDTVGNTTTSIEARDLFFASINAIDITKGSMSFGNIIKIK